jgi:hypothetical protein
LPGAGRGPRDGDRSAVCDPPAAPTSPRGTQRRGVMGGNGRRHAPTTAAPPADREPTAPPPQRISANADSSRPPDAARHGGPCRPRSGASRSRSA